MSPCIDTPGITRDDIESLLSQLFSELAGCFDTTLRDLPGPHDSYTQFAEQLGLSFSQQDRRHAKTSGILDQCRWIVPMARVDDGDVFLFQQFVLSAYSFLVFSSNVINDDFCEVRILLF
ncbi:MAG: hypothetical protein KatS3mg082_3401 [Nitrospiraceae bacterium]|nr:MAG: hypothetical protein KatS3mg082_3401 [Nitrospiraceae bacterium]